MRPGSERGPFSGGGRVLALGVALLARLRPAAKPMHPLGQVDVARLVRSGRSSSTTGTGAVWLDQPGTDDVLVRMSRSIGLPTPWPDVNGLAVRVPRGDGGYGDVLLSTTGWGRWTRYLLAASRTRRGGTFTTLVPYRTAAGAVHIGARSTGPGRFSLFWSRPAGDWKHFAELECGTDPGRDAAVSFDAILHPPEGLENYRWWARLRAPGYAAARRSRASSCLASGRTEAGRRLRQDRATGASRDRTQVAGTYWSQ